ncbi:MAG TPA: hypothetical protein VG759_27375 [Candidatus Angelobacter sp.]|nr:hypothetical protein [Candidatus Angelobacter sp.]
MSLRIVCVAFSMALLVVPKAPAQHQWPKASAASIGVDEGELGKLDADFASSKYPLVDSVTQSVRGKPFNVFCLRFKGMSAENHRIGRND